MLGNVGKCWELLGNWEIFDQKVQFFVTRAYPARAHRTFECPIKYWALRGGCPGWTAAGVRIPTHWNGDDITTVCQAEWRAFAATLPSARSMGSAEAKF